MVVHGSVILVPTETTESLRQIDRLCETERTKLFVDLAAGCSGSGDLETMR